MDTRVEWNDNRRMQVNNQDDATFGVVARVRLNAAVRTERGALSLTPRLTTRMYSNQKQLDSDDQALALRGNYALSERLRFRFSGRYQRDTSAQINILEVEEEAEEEAPPPDDADDSSQDAVIEAGSRRRRWQANPSLSYLVTERLSVGLAYSFTDVMYSRGAELGRPLSDFTQNRVTGSVSYALSPKDTLVGAVFGERYEAQIPSSPDGMRPLTDRTRSTTDSVGGNVRYTRRFSPTLDAYIGTGVYQSFFDVEGRDLDSDSDTGLLLDLGVTKEFENSELSGSYSRSLSPSSSGNLRQRDQVKMRYRHRLSETIRGKLDVRAFRTESTSSNDTDSTTDVFRITVGLEKRLTRNWRITGDYRYLFRDRESGNADSNAIFFGVVYDGDRYAVSR